MNWLRKLMDTPAEVPCERRFDHIECSTRRFRARRDATIAAIDAAILARTGIDPDLIREIPPEKVQALIALRVKLKG